MKNKIIADIEAAQLKQDLPDFSPGDTVVVQVKVVEGTRERLQAFKVLLSAFVAEASTQHSLFVRSLTALVLSVRSKLTAH